MGEAQKVPYQELLEQARAAFEDGTDLTVAVEEEFALLDPETLSLVNRFEDMKAAAAGTAVDDHLVGELIASEAEVRTGRCETFAEASERMGTRRAQLAEIAGGLGLAPRRHRRASLEPLAGPADHRHPALPPERRAAPLRGLAQQHVRAPPARGDRRRRPRDRRARRTPRVPAAPTRAVGELAARRGREQRIALRAHRDLHPHVPALRRPRRLPHLGGIRRVRAPALRDRLDRRAHADLVERAPAPRLSDRRDPHLRRAARPRRVARARGLRLRRSPPGSRERWTKASSSRTRPHG